MFPKLYKKGVWHLRLENLKHPTKALDPRLRLGLGLQIKIVNFPRTGHPVLIRDLC